MFTRSNTRCVQVGRLPLGGGAPVLVQTMVTANPHDVEALVTQVQRCEQVGADVVRLTVPDMQAANVLAEVVKRVDVPLVADIHFDERLALASVAAGVAALRLNPGNMCGRVPLREVASAAKERGVPIRIGVNGGSLERDLLLQYGGATAEALVASALRHIKLLEDERFYNIVVSVKASDVLRTVAAYRLLAEKTNVPLHLGVTEAGTLLPGAIRSSVAMGILLEEGLGDTIRVSLTDDPVKEVEVGIEILRSLGLRSPGAWVTSCPTCGRTQVDVVHVAQAVEVALAQLERAVRSQLNGRKFPKVAVMGCVVNGPGEARGADVALCGGDNVFLLYRNGKMVSKVSPDKAVATVVEMVSDILKVKEV